MSYGVHGMCSFFALGRLFLGFWKIDKNYQKLHTAATFWKPFFWKNDIDNAWQLAKFVELCSSLANLAYYIRQK